MSKIEVPASLSDLVSTYNLQFISEAENPGGGPACIGSIFSQGVDPFDNIERIQRYERNGNPAPGLTGEFLTVYPGYVEIRADFGGTGNPVNPYFLRKGRFNEKVVDVQNVQNVPVGYERGGTGAERGKITGFSRGSRRNMIKMFNRLEEIPQFWQDFTFPDDVFADAGGGLVGIEDRAKRSYECLRQLSIWIGRHYPGAWAIWRREWERRKSGGCVGELLPHFHVLLGGMEEVTEGNYKAVARAIAEKWVEILHTEHPKARSVAISEKSYRWLNDAKHASVYVSKYVGKVAKHTVSEGESLGRMWGKFGPVPLSEGVLMRLTPEESIALRRIFGRRIAREAKAIRGKAKAAAGRSADALREKAHILTKYAGRVCRYGASVFVLEKWEKVMEGLEMMRRQIFEELEMFFVEEGV